MEKAAILLMVLFTFCGKFSEFFDLWTTTVLHEKDVTSSEDLPDFVSENSRSSLKEISLVSRHGYPAEDHQITTEDGYVLHVHRIPGSPKSPPAPGKPVVYIQHGILGASVLFVLGGPDKDLAYILADAGYDVWLGNARGNTYSRSHKTLSPDTDRRFWKFSYHEIAIYDVSAAIDYALYKTGRKSLVYIGHSMGSTMSFVLLSTKPEYNDKVHLVINLATVCNRRQSNYFVNFFKDNGWLLKSLMTAGLMTEIMPRSARYSRLFQNMCSDGSALQEFCVSALRNTTGFDPDVLDFKLFVEAFTHNPAGASAQTFVHFYQNMIAGRLRMYDHGVMGNLARYRQITPPAYNLENVVTPVVMIYGKGDPIAPPEESLDLLDILKNARAESVPHDNFGHMDFLWAKNIKRLLQDRILEIISEFSERR
ncbi:hypothetical protein TSAR_002183 [Trichomalopsis sarcophagae]|uniref:Lipase n=1 Tax=Trichomalopsis sarcophagae TaxID=543379 RepID=A0A232EYJ6_9HYME|nr:hypothetical protein TSAR_002183 [Trichomalopsis sarcophagae]